MLYVGSTRLSQEIDCSIRKFSMFTHKFRLHMITFQIYEVEFIESEFQILLTYERFRVILHLSLLKQKNVDTTYPHELF